MSEIFLGNFELAEAKLLKLKLEEQGVALSIRAHDQTCNTKNCKITVEMWALEEDKEKIQEYFQKDFFKNLGHKDLNYEALNSVFDTNSEFVICQACGFKFETSHFECPDCGLSYK
jgi:predicted membrane-bound dolichyl-phosphate-mannose-protein mannosyltransferase